MFIIDIKATYTKIKPTEFSTLSVSYYLTTNQGYLAQVGPFGVNQFQCWYGNYLITRTIVLCCVCVVFVLCLCCVCVVFVLCLCCEL